MIECCFIYAAAPVVVSLDVVWDWIKMIKFNLSV